MKNIAGKIGKFLTEQKQRKQRVILFACLTVLVLYGTVTGLKLYGQAMNHRRDVLECQFELHKHDENCRDEHGELICGYADFVVHEHDEFCYDWNGKLVCVLPEYERHEHDAGCYEEVRTLICEEEAEEEDGETAASGNVERELTCDKETHTHTDSCYSGGESCGKEAHTHSEACETRTLTCEQAEHAHDASCQSSTLTCTEGEHAHGDGCYDEEGTLTCGQNEHAHGDGCYTTQIVCGISEHSHNDGCYTVEITCGQEEHVHDGSCGGDAALTCGKEEHEHNDGCWTVGEEAAGGDAETSEGHVHDDGCYITEKVLTCDKLELHEHDKAEKDNKCFDEDGNWICGVWELLEHQHDAGCLVTKELSPEEIADIGEQEAHIHTEECYEDGELACGYPAAHAHKDWCYDEDGELICGYETEEHVHIDKCYDEDGNVICGYEGACHLHDASCYDKYGELACGYGSLYHEHEEDCYDEDGNLICGYLEKEHEHTEDCYDEDGNLICGYPEKEHVHTEDCYDEDGNLICGYGEDDDESIIELRTEVEGITIILSGPQSSFDPEKEYSITAELVWQEETLAVIDDAVASLEETFTAVMPAAEAPEADAKDAQDAVEDEDADNAETESEVEVSRKVQGYYAFDIKLWADGVETEPLGPVSVRFEGGAVEEAANNEDTVSMVLHVDGETGDMTDMEAVEEDGAMAFETDHFSIYVYVNLQDIFGKLKLTVEHWGRDITVVDGTAVATGADSAFVTGDNPHVKTTTKNCEIYSTDEVEAPNEYYEDIRRLSKLYNTLFDEAGNRIADAELNYDMIELWVSTDMSNKGQETWSAGTYEVYTFTPESNFQLDMTDKGEPDENKILVQWNAAAKTHECIIRFWYKPKEAENQFPTPANFYDYDITDGTVTKYGSAQTQGNFNIRKSAPNGDVILTAGPDSWVPILNQETHNGWVWYKINYNGTVGWMRSDGLKIEKTYANQDYVKSEEQGINASGNFTSTSTNNRMGVGQQASGNLSSWERTARLNGDTGRYLNRFNSGQNAVVQGIVTNTLGADGKPQFNVTVPKTGFFASGIGSTAYTGKYQLRFKQNGDTYTLQNVYNTASGKNVTGDLTVFHKYDRFNSSYPSGLPSSGVWSNPVYSNDFWPMDDVQGKDPHMGTSLKQYRFLYNNGGELQKDDGPNPSDDNIAHNWHFGMEYEVTFKVGDYTGPMEFYFRGDDDLWLYIDNELAVDIGGIHSSAGETLDIRALLEKNGALTEEKKNEEHSMKIFYMERGGFGSCCYMQFTLPNSKPVEVPDLPTISYSVHKDWADGNAAFRPSSISVELIQILENGTNNETETGVVVELSDEKGWTYTWNGLPMYNGASQNAYTYSYKIQEIQVPGYTSSLVSNVLTNKLESTSVSVRKDWAGDAGLEDTYRPKDVLFQLYYRVEGSEDKFIPYVDLAKQPKVLKLSEDNNWSGAFENLPIYMNYVANRDDKGNLVSYTADEIEYTVYEVYEKDGKFVPYLEGEKADGLNDSKYEVSYAEDKELKKGIDTGFVVTNTLTSRVKIVKIGTAPNGNLSNEPVVGAVFKLEACSDEGKPVDSGTVYTGVANADGTIWWTQGEGTVGEDGKITPPAGASAEYVPDGTWLLSELQAPVNFELNDEKWIVVVKTGEALPSIKKADGAEVGFDDESTKFLEDGTAVLSFSYYDYLTLYELPHTGGVGMAWYTFAGALAVLASLACFTYKKRRTEG